MPWQVVFIFSNIFFCFSHKRWYHSWNLSLLFFIFRLLLDLFAFELFNCHHFRYFFIVTFYLSWFILFFERLLFLLWSLHFVNMIRELLLFRHVRLLTHFFLDLWRVLFKIRLFLIFIEVNYYLLHQFFFFSELRSYFLLLNQQGIKSIFYCMLSSI